jgi:hypothetical protein
VPQLSPSSIRRCIMAKGKNFPEKRTKGVQDKAEKD